MALTNRSSKTSVESRYGPILSMEIQAHTKYYWLRRIHWVIREDFTEEATFS